MFIASNTLANYVDVGSNKGLYIESLIRLDSVFYLRAAKSDSFESVGLGIGYKIKTLNIVLTADYENQSDTAFNLHAMYNDHGIPFFISYGKRNKYTNYKIGVGYPINEKVSLITHYSDNGLFVGVRRWL